MAYIVPSVLVQQVLANAGGVSTATPNLEACIVGPAYNILTYLPGNSASQIKTAALSATQTTGSMVLASYDITVVSTAGFNAGDSVLVVGAGSSGGTLQANIVTIAGNVITLDAPAATAVTGAVISKSGAITNSLVDNTFILPGQIAGQVITVPTVSVWFNNAYVQTLTSGFRVNALSNVVTMETAAMIGATTGDVGATASTITSVTPVLGYEIGDTISVVNAGDTGGTIPLVTTITNIVGTTFTISPAALNTAPLTGTGITKVVPTNLNSTTNTLRAEPGDKVKFTYLDSGSVAHVFTSSIQTVVTSSGLNGTITNFSMVDSMPSSVLGTDQVVLLSVEKIYNDQQVPNTNPLLLTSQIDTTLTGAQGTVTVKADVSLIYGPVITADVYVAYDALRTDLSGTVLTINDVTDLTAQLGEATDANPLALAIQVALANTTGRIRAIAVASNDLAGHEAALTTSEGERLYFMTPLTQDPAVIALYKAHCLQMSTPENASWRVTLANTAMPLTQTIGSWTATAPNSNGGNNSTSSTVGGYLLNASNATFITDGVLPGDVIYFTAATAAPTQVGAHKVVSVISNQQLVVNTTASATAISYYITRTMSKTQTAEAVAAVSAQWNTSRVIHVQPDIVGVQVSGVTKYLPGYYLCAGLAGMGAGFAVQQGFTNVGVAGVVDLQHSNFYFSKADLNTMAGAGTCLFVQDTQGGNPYCRHELTTDMSTLNYRELLMVKELDYLSYFYYDKLKSFIGSWNITPSSLNTLRQTIVAGSELIKSQILPKVGAVLLSYNITTLKQDPVNTDHVICVMTVAIGTPMNYIDLTLVV